MRGPSPHDPEGVFTRPRRPQWPEAPFLNDDGPAASSAPVPGEVDERARVRLVVVMPVGPGEDLHDTLASVDAYTDASRAIVLVDDTGRGASGPAPEADAETGVHVVPAPAGATGSRGGLWVKIAAGYRYACERFAFDLVLRMDTDALMLGPGIEEAALRRFADDPRLGLLGSYRVGPDGGRRDFGPPARTLARESGLLGLGRPRLRAQLRALLEHARGAGYAPGEHALGGAFLHSAAAARALQARGWLDLPHLARSRLGEDHIFALLTVAAGFRIGDFGRPGDPLALRWRGLPAHPEALLAGPALVTHSVRGYGDLDETAVRELFARARRPPGASSRERRA
jgi:hypothetical protein